MLTPAYSINLILTKELRTFLEYKVLFLNAKKRIIFQH